MRTRDDGEPEVDLHDPGREALRAGHPIAWSVLVAGTSLEGIAWPGWGISGWDAPHQTNA